MPNDSQDPADAPARAKLDARHERRLLGRLLGEVVREQHGEATLELIEQVRRTAVRFRRAELAPGNAADMASARAELAATLNASSVDDTLQIELLRRYRSGDRDERVKRAIHLTINRVAAGLRNSG